MSTVQSNIDTLSKFEHEILNLILYFSNCPGFPKLNSPKAKVGKTLFGLIKPTNLSVWMAYKGQNSFGIKFCNIVNLSGLQSPIRAY